MKNLLTLMLIVLWITACSNADELKEITVEGIPIRVYNSNDQRVDVDTILNQVKESIKEYMPEGRYGFMYIRGDCRDLQDLKGTITFQFFEEKERWFNSQPQIFYAAAFVNINQETLDISIRNETNHYPSTDSYKEVNNEVVQKVIESAVGKIASLGIDQCSVEISQLKNSWNVLCEPQNDNERKCSFSIDPETYEAKEYIPPK